jgi:fatty acid-binding protein DegV
MTHVKVVTDSGIGLPGDLVSDYDLRVVPAALTFGGRLVREGIDLTAGQLYEYLAGSPDEVPCSSHPLAGDFLAIYDQAIADAPDAAILSLHPSRRLTAFGDLARTDVAARAAADQFPGTDYRFVDSGTCMLGQGLLALDAAQMAANGADVFAVHTRLQALRDALHLACLVDTAYAVADCWQLTLPAEPYAILRLRDGALVVEGRYASRAAGLDALRALPMLGHRDSDVQVGVMHASMPDDAAWLAEAIGSALEPVRLVVGEITPVYGVVLGPGALGTAWIAL